MRPPADGSAIAVGLAAVARMGEGASGEAGGLLGVHRAQFGHFDQQGEGAHAGDAGNGEQDREAPGQFGIGLAAAFDLSFDGGQDRTWLPKKARSQRILVQ